jgi:CRISPR/Cas system-associated endonuclease/helicase Cas3
MAQDPPRGLIVVGTQTLGQCLDIDVDFIITDLCAAGALFAAIGQDASPSK